jgi:hypothetical protein
MQPTRAKETLMSESCAIPAPILALMQKPPLLKGESVQQYNELLGELVSQVAPVDIVEWLWVLNFLDSAWDVLRIRRFKAVLIDLQYIPALRAVLVNRCAINEKYTPVGLAKAEALWLADPTLFAKNGIDPLSVPATAAIQIRKSLEALDKRMERAERRCDSIMQQLEYRREVFAHRARRAADNILNAQTAQIPSLPSSETAPPLAPIDQTTPNQIPADEVAMAPTSSAAEAGVPGSGKTSAEISQPTSSQPADQTTPNQIPADEVAIVPTSPAVAAAVPSSEATPANISEPVDSSDA